MTQPDLFNEYAGTIDSAIDRCKEADRLNGGARASDTAWEAFREYHNSRPSIFTAFRRFANEAIASGRDHFSSMAVIDRIRWESLTVAPAPPGAEDEYKVCNTAHPFYARVFMEFEAQHQGFFEIKSRPLTGLVKAIKD